MGLEEIQHNVQLTMTELETPLIQSLVIHIPTGNNLRGLPENKYSNLITAMLNLPIICRKIELSVHKRPIYPIKSLIMKIWRI
jgi:hypothetical protein